MQNTESHHITIPKLFNTEALLDKENVQAIFDASWQTWHDYYIDGLSRLHIFEEENIKDVTPDHKYWFKTRKKGNIFLSVTLLLTGRAGVLESSHSRFLHTIGGFKDAMRLKKTDAAKVFATQTKDNILQHLETDIILGEDLRSRVMNHSYIETLSRIQAVNLDESMSLVNIHDLRKDIRTVYQLLHLADELKRLHDSSIPTGIISATIYSLQEISADLADLRDPYLEFDLQREYHSEQPVIRLDIPEKLKTSIRQSFGE